MGTTAPDTLAFATEVAIVNMHYAGQWIMLLCLQKSMHDLLLDQPGTIIANATVSGQCER